MSQGLSSFLPPTSHRWFGKNIRPDILRVSTSLPNAMSRGFTLIELVLVMFLVGIIAAFAYPYLEGAIDDSRYMECESNLEAIRRAKSLYVVDHLGEGSPVSQESKDVFDCYFVHPITKQCPRVPGVSYTDPYDVYAVSTCPFCSNPANIPSGVSEYVGQP